MTRRLLWLPMLLIVLSSCAEDPAASQQTEVAEKLAEGLTLLQRAAVTDMDDLKAQLLDEAIGMLKPLKNQGSNSQRFAARIALSQAHAGQADRLSRQAVKVWSEQVRLVPAALESLGTAAQTHGLTGAHAAIDLAPTRGDLERRAALAREEIDATATEVDRLTNAIETLDERRGQRLAARQEQVEAADRLKGQAFEVEGQLHVDLMLRAAQHTTEADRLGADADRAEAERELEADALAIAAAKHRNQQSQLQSMLDAINALGDKDEALQDHTQALNFRADEHSIKLNEQFVALAGKFGQVSEKLAEAEGQLSEALSALVGIGGPGPGNQRDIGDVELGIRQADMGRIKVLQEQLLRDYRDLLEALSGHSDQVIGGDRRSVVQTLEQMNAQGKEAVAEAITELSEAAETLQRVMDRCRDESIRRNARLQLCDVSCTLFALTGEAAYETQCSELRSDPVPGGTPGGP